EKPRSGLVDTTGRVGPDGGLEPEEPKPEEQPTAPLTEAEDAASQEAESATSADADVTAPRRVVGQGTPASEAAPEPDPAPLLPEPEPPTPSQDADIYQTRESEPAFPDEEPTVTLL